ncbi:hypothetical protein ACTFIW_005520 [Dictyostelium discoideum]
MENNLTVNPNPLCSICNIKKFIYSCPKCKNIKYCSLICFSKHKELVNNHETPVEININKEENKKDDTILDNDIKMDEPKLSPTEIESKSSSDSSSSENENEDEEEGDEDEEEEEEEEESGEESEDEKVKIRKEPIDNSKVSRFSESLNYFKKVSDEQFQKLDNSKYINSVITVKSLQQLIIEIDQQPSDQDKIQLLQQYRKKLPEFNEFILKVLATIGCLDSLTIDENDNLIKK